MPPERGQRWGKKGSRLGLITILLISSETIASRHKHNENEIAGWKTEYVFLKIRSLWTNAFPVSDLQLSGWSTAPACNQALRGAGRFSGHRVQAAAGRPKNYIGLLTIYNT